MPKGTLRHGAGRRQLIARPEHCTFFTLCKTLAAKQKSQSTETAQQSGGLTPTESPTGATIDPVKCKALSWPNQPYADAETANR